MSLFVSHGAPTFALEPGLAGPALTELGKRLTRPEAVLVVSPHWMTEGIRAASRKHLRQFTIFGAFQLNSMTSIIRQPATRNWREPLWRCWRQGAGRPVLTRPGGWITGPGCQ